jgi:hypothetical protein
MAIKSIKRLICAKDAHRGVRGEGGYETAPPRQIFEKLVNKNAIKPKIGGPPQAMFPETLDPPRNFGKNFKYPPPPWIFNPCASMICANNDFQGLNEPR